MPSFVTVCFYTDLPVRQVNALLQYPLYLQGFYTDLPVRQVAGIEEIMGASVFLYRPARKAGRRAR